jgi:hypothetical protein
VFLIKLTHIQGFLERRDIFIALKKQFKEAVLSKTILVNQLKEAEQREEMMRINLLENKKRFIETAQQDLEENNR